MLTCRQAHPNDGKRGVKTRYFAAIHPFRTDRWVLDRWNPSRQLGTTGPLNRFNPSPIGSTSHLDLQLAHDRRTAAETIFSGVATSSELGRQPKLSRYRGDGRAIPSIVKTLAVAEVSDLQKVAG